MIHGKSVLGLILARGGSKGLPGKNVRPLRGKPLIGWTIDAAKKSTVLDALVLSTDAEDIAATGRALGAEVPFMRPTHLASDTSTSMDAIAHAVQWLADAGRTFEYLVLLEPTSPLREASDIDTAVTKLHATGADSIVSVTRAESAHPAFMYFKSDKDVLKPFVADGDRSARRQDTAPVFFLEGTVYASRIESLLRRRSFYHEGTLGLEVPKWKSPEIDDEVDFLLVEAIMKHRGIGS